MSDDDDISTTSKRVYYSWFEYIQYNTVRTTVSSCLPAEHYLLSGITHQIKESSYNNGVLYYLVGMKKCQ